jgi:ribosomal protein S18 acetylase RimI-like enzyme
MESDTVIVRRITDADRAWVTDVLTLNWGSTRMISRGQMIQIDEQAGFIAEPHAGLVTYQIVGDECEVTLLNSFQKASGIGTALLNAVADEARRANCRRVWLITTNDNTPALRFYQRRGYVLVAVHREAVLRSRELKPEIPHFGIDGIPIRDEIELELIL